MQALAPNESDRSLLASVAIVLIGRNEAARLGAAIQSIPTDIGVALYVDSQSTDASTVIAREAGLKVIELPADTALSAATARNAGFAVVLELQPSTQFVQFMDGDCQLEPGWLEKAVAAMSANPALGAVWGWRSEVNAVPSIYNRLCDMEWRIPPAGPTRHFGGDALIRVTAFEQSEGYYPTATASEDHDFSLRMTAGGWKIERLDTSMTIHDSAIDRASQWWRRCKRKGAGYVIVWTAHRKRPELIGIVRTVTWALAFPICVAILTMLFGPLSLGLLIIYLVRAIRIALTNMRDRSWADRILWGCHCVAASFPYAAGIVSQFIRQSRGIPNRLIEYRP